MRQHGNKISCSLRLPYRLTAATSLRPTDSIATVKFLPLTTSRLIGRRTVMCIVCIANVEYKFDVNYFKILFAFKDYFYWKLSVRQDNKKIIR